ncbi:MAG: thioredoxin domain-containing protein [Ignavibacteria bacterium]|nr:thioredoxin domain-containing protein [Ignavibacteria bacterium]
MKELILTILVSFAFFSFISCNKSETKHESQNQAQQNEPTAQGEKSQDNKTQEKSYKIEFIELGSVKCIPCRKMQPILSSIEKKYGEQLKVTFFDVCKDPIPAQKYGINIIPTQIFLDDKGNELLRHEGFFPEEEIDKFLQSKGLKIINP